MKQWEKCIYEVEIQRSNITPRAFFSAAKKAMEKHGADISCWIDSFEDWKNPVQKNNSKWNHEDGEIEICRTLPYNWQFYFEGAYNFIFEFDFWDDEKGFGYLYAVENDR